MYTIELTRGQGWDAPTLQARAIKTTEDYGRFSESRVTGGLLAARGATNHIR
jgi:hypothetical protein